MILAEGSLVASGAVEELRGRQAARFRVTLADAATAGRLRDVEEIDVLDVCGSAALLSIGQRRPEDVLAEIVTRVPVAEFARVVRPLAEVYREVVA